MRCKLLQSRLSGFTQECGSHCGGGERSAEIAGWAMWVIIARLPQGKITPSQQAMDSYVASDDDEREELYCDFHHVAYVAGDFLRIIGQS